MQNELRTQNTTFKDEVLYRKITKNTQILFSLPTKNGGSVPLKKLRFILSIKIKKRPML